MGEAKGVAPEKAGTRGMGAASQVDIKWKSTFSGFMG